MISGIFRAIEISATGLSAQRQKMNIVSENIANAQTTRTADGGPYKRQRVQFKEHPDYAPFGKVLNRAVMSMRRTKSGHMTNPARATSQRDNVSPVEAKTYVDQEQAPRLVFDPAHPDANEEGYVAMPDVNVVTEMVEMMVASRSYEANITAIESAKKMARRALDI
jgi:flagellar basal-body rod protein FlgC